jgi:copper chaperone CopZ
MKKVILLMVAVLFMAANGLSAKNTESTLKVEGACGMCKSRIEKAAKSVEGVTTAEWNKETKVLKLAFDSDKSKLETISKAIAKSGHDTAKDKATDETYKALPGCCHYRK